MQFIFTYEEEANYYFTQRLIQTYRNKVLKRGVGEGQKTQWPKERGQITIYKTCT
jgi:hypothetical protein